MASIDVKCPLPGCNFSTGEVPEVAVALLNTHALLHSGSSGATAARGQGPKLERPRVECGISIEEWNIFQRRWTVFRNGSDISDSHVSTQLFQCASEGLGDAMLKVDPDVTTRDIDTVIASMKSLAVIPVAIGVLRAELLEMHQKRDESFRSFATRVRGKAETCNFVTKNDCTCGKRNTVDYTENTPGNVLVAGIYDVDIRRDILAIDGVVGKATNEVVALVERAEMALDANHVSASTSASTSAIYSKQEGRSLHSNNKQVRPPPGLHEPCSASRAKQIPCLKCSNLFSPFTEGRGGFNNKPH